MKKILNLWLMAALLCGLGLSVTSCKDDDDNNGSGEAQTEEQAEQALKFWSVVGQLVSSDDYTADYADKTFEPVYGIADATNETTRIVETNDMATAASYFADLINVGDGSAVTIDENTPSYTYSDPEVGTLTYTRGGTANEWATVDVNIKQVPRLRKIVYRVGGEGTNTAFAGKAWYRFGDVVSRQNKDGQTEYWICVHPAFGPEKQSDSHWVCLNTLPTKNLYHVSGSNGTQYYVPTGVGTNNKRMQDLAEMLYAMVYPEKWYETATNNHTDGLISSSGVPIFTDFTKANLMYHNQYFWQRVAAAWEKHSIADKAMNTNFGSFVDRIEREGITLLYGGYSWWSKMSWNCKLYQASYTNGTANDKKNLHSAVYTKPEKNMRSIKFDCRTMGDAMSNYQEFFGDTKLRWVIRHATGKELNGGSQPAPTAQLQGGCQEVYRYYTEYPEEWEKPGPNGDNGPEITEEQKQLEIPAKVGALVGANGLFYENKANCEAAGTQPIAVVVYLSTDGHRVEKGQPWTGLAMELKDFAEGGKSTFKWLEAEKTEECVDLCTSMGSITMSDDVNSRLLDGWAMTKRLASHECFNHHHPAAEKAWSAENRPDGFSEWFIPSAGQWIIAMKAMGYTYAKDGDNVWSFSGHNNGLLHLEGLEDADLGAHLYCSTTQDRAPEKTLYINSGTKITFREKNLEYSVRRMIAFGQGGNTDPEAVAQPIQPRPGAIVSARGNFYASTADLTVFEGANSSPIGMVVYYDPTKRVEKGTNYNGLAISVIEIMERGWDEGDAGQTSVCGTLVYDAADYDKALDGLAVTKALAQGKNHKHPAAEASYVKNNFLGFSYNFMPSAGQWILAKQGMGYTWTVADGKGTFDGGNKWKWAEAGMSNYALENNQYYWTCTEQKNSKGNYAAIVYGPNSINMAPLGKTTQHRVRPFFAFGHWGTEDPAPIEPRQEVHTLNAPVLGCAVGADGEFYANKADAEQYGGGAVAIVACLNGKGEVDQDVKSCNGLAIATTSIKDVKFSNGTTECNLDLNGYIFFDSEGIYNGIDGTETLTNGCGNKKHDHPAAKQCRDYKPALKAEAKAKHSFTDWFMPSYGQWILVCRSFGMKVVEGTTKQQMQDQLPKVAELFKAKGWNWDGVFDQEMWSCTQWADGITQALLAGFLAHADDNKAIPGTEMTEAHPVVPFMAFKYDAAAKSRAAKVARRSIRK